MATSTKAVKAGVGEADKVGSPMASLIKPISELSEAKRSLQEAAQLLTAKGTMHEMQYEMVDGLLMRTYIHAPPTARHLFLATKAYGSRPYLVYQEERISYLDSHRLVAVIAHILQKEFGVRKGARVAIVMCNLPEWVLAFWAVTCIGAISVAVNAWLSPDAMAHIVTKAGATVCIVDNQRAQKLQPVFEDLLKGGVKAVLAPRLEQHAKGVQPFEDLIKQYDWPEHHKVPDVDLFADDMMTIFTTSGTTGSPKLVPSTHRMFITNLFNAQASQIRACLRSAEDLPAIDPAAPQKGSLLPGPLFHVAGCHGVLQVTTAIGGKIVIMAKWNVDEAVRLIKEESLTSVGGVPFMAAEIVTHQKQTGDTTLESVMLGGAPPPLRITTDAAERVPTVSIAQAYGLTETNAYAVGFTGQDYLMRPMSAGLPAPIVDLKIMGPDTLVEMPVGDTGEIWLRGASVVREYYNDPEATAAAFTRDGWFRTGDLGWVDKEGFLYVVDRAKDILIRGGENIACRSVEDVIYTDRRILDVAVVPVPDERLGELVAAVVAPKRKHVGRVTEEQVIKTCRKLLPKHCIPVMVDVRQEALERNANGKVVKKDLKDKTAKLWRARKGGGRSKL